MELKFFSNPFYVHKENKKIYIGNKAVAAMVLAGLAAAPLALIGGVFAFLTVAYCLKQRKIKDLSRHTSSPTTQKIIDHVQPHPHFPVVPPVSPTTPLGKMQKTSAQVQQSLKENPAYPDKVVSFMQTVKKNNAEEIKLAFKTANPFTINEHVEAIIQYAMRPSEVTGYTPLTYTIKNGFYDTFLLLIDSPHIDLNKEVEGMNAFFIACSQGKEGEKFLLKLIEKRADPLGKKSENEIAYELAKKAGASESTLEKLKKYQEIHLLEADGSTELHRAVRAGSLDKVKEVLAQRGTLEHKDTQGMSPLAMALVKWTTDNATASRDIVDLLIEEGAYLETKFGNLHITPLLYVLAYQPQGWEEIASKMLDKGAYPFTSDRLGDFSSMDFVRDLPHAHPVKQHIIEHAPAAQEMIHRMNLATLYGFETWSPINPQIGLHINGGNFPVYIYELFTDFIERYEKETPPLFNLSEEDQTKFKKGLNLSLKLLQPSDNRLTLLKEAVELCKEVPLLLSTGWKGHAVTLVIYQDRLWVCNRGERAVGVKNEIGIQSYRLASSDWSTTQLNWLQQFVEKSESLTKGNFIPTLKQRLGAQLIEETPYKPQKHSNCTWVSTMLGLKQALSLMKGDSVQKFSHFSRYQGVKKLVENSRDRLSKIDYLIDRSLLGKTASKLVKKIKEGHDLFGYYRKALDLLTYSGLPLSISDLSSNGLLKDYAKLYDIEDVALFEKTLQPVIASL